MALLRAGGADGVSAHPGVRTNAPDRRAEIAALYGLAAKGRHRDRSVARYYAPRMSKTYDRHYFDKWYRSGDRVHERGEVRRKAALAVSTTEYFLRRRIETVLDVGCGEGAWYRHLRSIRPRLPYTGIVTNTHALSKCGAKRN